MLIRVMPGTIEWKNFKQMKQLDARNYLWEHSNLEQYKSKKMHNFILEHKRENCQLCWIQVPLKLLNHAIIPKMPDLWSFPTISQSLLDADKGQRARTNSVVIGCNIPYMLVADNRL